MSSYTFGDWLKHQRTLRKMTQEDLERAAGLGRKYVSKLERGLLRYPMDGVRGRIHEALGTTDDDLVDAGIVDKWEYEGSAVYIAKEPRRGRGITEVRPGTELPIEYVQEELVEAADAVQWTQGLLDGVLYQIRGIAESQSRRITEPRASWEDEE